MYIETRMDQRRPPRPVAVPPKGAERPLKPVIGKTKRLTADLEPKADAAKRGNDVTRPCAEHSFLTDIADVREMEQGLLQLLQDFHSGKLQAFGTDAAFEKMDQVREQQERLARLHFELDTSQHMKGFETQRGRDLINKNLNELMEHLQELCESIQNIHKTKLDSLS